MQNDIHDDIHQGIEQDHIPDKPILFSVGHRCTTASLIKELRLKFESYPFDWIVSKLETVKHCIETDFVIFLDKDQYSKITSETLNLCDDTKIHVTSESIVYNTYYESVLATKGRDGLPNRRGTYGYMLALTHHVMTVEKDHEYFERCVNRFRRILASDKKKFYLYVNPLIGPKEFDASSADLLLHFIEFGEFMATKTARSFGIFFIVVKNEERKHEVVNIYECDAMVVFVMYTNNNLVDGGGVYDGDFYTEQYKMLVTIENVIQTRV